MSLKIDVTQPLSSSTLNLSSISLSQYRLNLMAIDGLQLPPFKGSTLRGGFGHTFKSLACIQPWPCDKYCQAGNKCAYGYIFETTPPDDAQVLRNFQNVPRPFIIVPPKDSRTYIPPGDILTFGLTLVGKAEQYHQSFKSVFEQLGRIGLGKTQGKYQLKEMSLIARYNSEHFACRAATLPSSQITLNFITPARLKHRGRWVNEGPPFDVLVNKLLSRTSSLSYFHCDQRLDLDFRGLIDQAATVKIVNSQTRWEDWSRVSGRQRQRIKLGGLIGQVTYQGDLAEYLPLLALGELIHVGKGTVFGNGQYKIEKNHE